MCAVTPMKRFVKKSVRGIHTTFTSSKNVQYRLSVKDIRVRKGITNHINCYIENPQILLF